MVSLTRPVTIKAVPASTSCSTVFQLSPSIEYWTTWSTTGSSEAEYAGSHWRIAEESPPRPVKLVGAVGGPTGMTVIDIGPRLCPVASTAVTWNV